MFAEGQASREAERIYPRIQICSYFSWRFRLEPVLFQPMAKSYIFSSESVTEGHPDKVADTISDAVLDACLAQDKHSRVACETYAKSNLVVVGGDGWGSEAFAAAVWAKIEAFNV